MLDHEDTAELGLISIPGVKNLQVVALLEVVGLFVCHMLEWDMGEMLHG